MYSLRARYYNPAGGRFLSRDTYPINFGDPWELNRYGYTAGNPVRWTDPTGWLAATYSLKNQNSVRVGSSLAPLVVGVVVVAVVAIVIAYQLIANALPPTVLPPLTWIAPRPTSVPVPSPWVPVPTAEPWRPPTAAPRPTPGDTPLPTGTVEPLPTMEPTPPLDPQANKDPVRVPFPIPAPVPPRSTGCDPSAFTVWWNLLPNAPIGGAGNPNAAAYEARVARGLGTLGTTKTVPHNLPISPANIDADGADAQRCLLLEAKHNKNPNRPTWAPNEFPPILDRADNEIIRYRAAVLLHPNVMGLEIRTDNSTSVTYFAGRLAHFGFTPAVDGFVMLMP
jgi:hypothetical protein